MLAALSMLAMSLPARAEPVKIRAAWVAPISNWASILLAKKDLAQHLGKTYILEPVRFTGTPEMITALSVGELEIADLAYSSLGLAIQNAGLEDVRIISDEFQDGAAGYYSGVFSVLKDSPVQKVEDIKGKIVASNAAGSAVDIAMRAMLRKHKLEDKRDYTMIEAPLPAMLAMVKEKKADLVPGVLPFSLSPDFQASTRPLFTQKDVMGPSQMTVWTARKGFIDKNRAALTDFMEDTIRIVRWYLDPKNHDEAVKIAAGLTKLPEDRFAPWLFTKSDYYRDSSLIPNLAALQSSVNVAKEFGFLAKDLDVNRYADLSIVQEAAKRLK